MRGLAGGQILATGVREGEPPGEPVLHRSVDKRLGRSLALPGLGRAAGGGPPAVRGSVVRKRAFTIIEMLAVLVIIGILAGAVTLTMAARVEQARMGDVVARVRQLDGWTRRDAARFGRPAELVYDLDRESAHRLIQDQAPDRLLNLPAGFRLGAVRVAEELRRDGQTTIDCSAEGRTASYAVLVTGPADAQSWVLFAGLSGDSVVLASESDVDAAFASLVAERREGR